MKNYLRRTLFRSLLPEREGFIIVRVRTSASLADYILWVGVTFITILAFCVCLLGCFSLALDAQIWRAWREEWQSFLLQFIYIRPSGVFPIALGLVDLCAFLLVMTLIAYGMMRKSLRELRGIIAVTRGRSPHFVLPSGYVKWELAPYVTPEIITNPTPNEAVEIAKGKLDTWKTAVDTLLREYPLQPTPLVSMKVVLTHQLHITLVGQNGEPASLLIENEKQAELITFLAFQQRGEWVRRKTLMTKIYGIEKESNFSMDIKRVREKINEQALIHGLVHVEDIDQFSEQSMPEKSLLFENEKRKNESYWRLSPHCEMVIFPELQAMYQQARAEEQQPKINLEERLRGLKKLVGQYGNERGLLGAYQSFPAVWLWLEEYYKLYRTQWLFLLNNTAKRMLNSIDGDPKNEQDLEALRNVALLYRWAAQASNSLFASLSLDENSETYLLESLRYYRLLHDFENARTLYLDYSKKRRKRDRRWQPHQKTKDEWPEVIVAAQPKKTQKANNREKL